MDAWTSVGWLGGGLVKVTWRMMGGRWELKASFRRPGVPMGFRVVASLDGAQLAGSCEGPVGEMRSSDAPVPSGEAGQGD